MSTKEQRVETVWNKRGLIGLRSDLLGVMMDGGSDDELVLKVSRVVYGRLPKREWDKAERIIRETCGLTWIEIEGEWEKVVKEVRQTEEQLRVDLDDDYEG